MKNVDEMISENNTEWDNYKITLDGVNTQTMRKLDGNVAGQDPLSTCLLDLDSDRAI
jgi:hypothetical protein